jgi:hypothetical protein
MAVMPVEYNPFIPKRDPYPEFDPLQRYQGEVVFDPYPGAEQEALEKLWMQVKQIIPFNFSQYVLVTRMPREAELDQDRFRWAYHPPPASELERYRVRQSMTATEIHMQHRALSEYMRTFELDPTTLLKPLEEYYREREESKAAQKDGT